MPLEHTPDPQPTLYEGNPFIWGWKGMFGVCPRGMLGFLDIQIGFWCWLSVLTRMATTPKYRQITAVHHTQTHPPWMFFPKTKGHWDWWNMWFYRIYMLDLLTQDASGRRFSLGFGTKNVRALSSGLINHWFPLLRPAIKPLFLRVRGVRVVGWYKCGGQVEIFAVAIGKTLGDKFYHQLSVTTSDGPSTEWM